MTTRGLCTCRGRSQPGVFRKRCGRSTGLPSADGRGMAGRSRERRNGGGGLEQAGGPRRYSRGLVAARSVTCRSASSVPGGPTAGQGRRACGANAAGPPCRGTLGGRWRRYRVVGSWRGRNSAELSVHQSVSHGPDDDLLLAAESQLVLYVVDGVADRR